MQQESKAYTLLDERIRRFIWKERWNELSDIQERAIPCILEGHKDVILSAATAAGKTEAAFFPVLSHLLKSETKGLVIYVSPVKALINDQFGRLQRLCEELYMPVWPWHGDISSSLKNAFQKEPWGILLITPESLEASLCNKGSSLPSLFEYLQFWVIDELHVFMGSERGKQLQSLCHRLERVLERRVPRIGLSATLGDMSLAAEYLRPGRANEVELIESRASHGEARVQLQSIVLDSTNSHDNEAQTVLAHSLYPLLRDGKHLVFPNSRKDVECYTFLLNEQCALAGTPASFWPHHGSLHKELRTQAEDALKKEGVAACAVCTSTLELGIDIGSVKSVVQVGTPPTVASLRQRMGRSGRRNGDVSVLRAYAFEETLNEQTRLMERLRLDTVQSAASIALMLEGWCEPPRVDGMHLSTLVQQLLSLSCQKEGVTALEAYGQLCGDHAPFASVSKEDFIALLRHLGAKEVLCQSSEGLLLPGVQGEKMASHYTFYAAFQSPLEYRLMTEGQELGTIPVSQTLTVGKHLLFGGRTWVIEVIQEAKRCILVKPASVGRFPALLTQGGLVHTQVRERMKALLMGSGHISFLASEAQEALEEARQEFKILGLQSVYLMGQGSECLVWTWLGDGANEALAAWFRLYKLNASLNGPAIAVMAAKNDVEALLMEMAHAEFPAPEALLENANNLIRQKWDHLLPKALLLKGFASQHLDREGAGLWLKRQGEANPEGMEPRGPIA